MLPARPHARSAENRCCTDGTSSWGTSAKRRASRMKTKLPCIAVKQTVRLPDADFSVEEGETLLQAIFPNYPDVAEMKPAPEIGIFLRTLRSRILASHSARCRGA